MVEVFLLREAVSNLKFTNSISYSLNYIMVLIIPAGLSSWFKNTRKSVFGFLPNKSGSKSAIPKPIKESEVLFWSQS